MVLWAVPTCDLSGEMTPHGFARSVPSEVFAAARITTDVEGRRYLSAPAARGDAQHCAGKGGRWRFASGRQQTLRWRYGRAGPPVNEVLTVTVDGEKSVWCYRRWRKAQVCRAVITLICKPTVLTPGTALD